MRHYCLFLLSVICLLSQGCDNGDGHALDMTETQKKVVVSLEGIPEETYPWLSIGANTSVNNTLYLVQDNDIKAAPDGALGIHKGKMPPSGKVMFFEKGYFYDGICLTVIYRKRMTTAPSDSDNLTVRVRGYIDNVLSLDTVRVMRAFRKEEKIERSDYAFDIIF